MNKIRSKRKEPHDDTKVTQYLEEMDKFNQQQKEKRAANLISENGSNGSNNGQENGSGSNGAGSNLPYLDSTGGHRNISGTAPGSGSGNSNTSVQYVPVLIICCPNLLKNEPCFCGH